MKFRVFIGLVFVVASSNLYAGEVAKGEIEEIYNTVSGKKEFGVRMSADSTGPCAGQWVRFREANFPDNIESYKFAFSMAMTAIATGKKIRAHNYSNNECDGVTFMGLYK